MSNYSEEQIINAGSGTEITIRELADMVREVTGYPGQVAWDTSKPDGTPRKLMDSSRLFALGWKPQTSLESGIQRAYNDFRQRFP